MDAIIKNNNQSKMCRQCHRTKSLVHFVNKNNTGICIICKSCRENQMKRYYGSLFIHLCNGIEKKMLLKKENERMTMSKRIAKQERVPQSISCDSCVMVPPSSYYVNPRVSTPLHQGVVPFQSCQFPVIVPSSRWVSLTNYYCHSNGDFFQAKLVYHSSFSNCESTMSVSSTESSP